MKNILGIFRADFKRISNSVVASVVIIGLILVPCLYAWFNILSNWDPYGPASTSNIKVAVVNEDKGARLLGMNLNIGSLVMDGLASNNQLGWEFMDTRQEAIDGVYAGDYYAALIVSKDFTNDFVSVLDNDLRHPKIEYYENEKKNAIAPKITNKAKNAVQEQVNNTIMEKVADAINMVSSVLGALGVDAEDIGGSLTKGIDDAYYNLGDVEQLLVSLRSLMSNVGSLLDCTALTLNDLGNVMTSASQTVGAAETTSKDFAQSMDNVSADAQATINKIDSQLTILTQDLQKIPGETERLEGFADQINALKGNIDAVTPINDQQALYLAAASAYVQQAASAGGNLSDGAARASAAAALGQAAAQLEAASGVVPATLDGGQDAPADDPAQDPAGDPNQDPSNDPAQDPTGDPTQPPTGDPAQNPPVAGDTPPDAGNDTLPDTAPPAADPSIPVQADPNITDTVAYTAAKGERGSLDFLVARGEEDYGLSSIADITQSNQTVILELKAQASHLQEKLTYYVPTDQAKAQVLQDIANLKDSLQAYKTANPDAAASVDKAISGLDNLTYIVTNNAPTSETQAKIKEVREALYTAALVSNKAINDFIQEKTDGIEQVLQSVQTVMQGYSGKVYSIAGSVGGYGNAIGSTTATLSQAIGLVNSTRIFLKEISDDVDRITNSAAFKELVDIINNNPDGLADYLSSPIDLKTIVVYEIKDYGSAMAPYYIMLALFVGSLLSSTMIKVPVKYPRYLSCNPIQRYFGRQLLFNLIVLAQAIITALGCMYYVGMQCLHPLLFILACCICSLNFMAMNYALVYALDNIGMAAAVIIMVIQVAGSGGSYPIHVVPKFFQKLYVLMPFHYGMDIVRETIGGLYGHTYLKCAAVLLGMCVIFTIFGLLVYYPAKPLNDAIAKSKEKSGIM